MYLHRLHLDLRSKAARRDLSDPYQMHATLCRAFFPPSTPCPAGSLLWRLEPETDVEGRPRVLIQTRAQPDWTRIPDPNWLAHADPALDLQRKLALDTLSIGHGFHFRLRANPSKSVQGKRQGLIHPDAQLAWLRRKGEQHGFSLPECAASEELDSMQRADRRGHGSVLISHEKMLDGNRHGNNVIRVYSVLFEGHLTVMDPVRFRQAVETGIGRGKVMGLGLLSVMPIFR